jgi:hypothetical protein
MLELGANEVMWECFYCPYVAPQQVAVVGHVIAAHPNKPIQLKRVPAVSDGHAEQDSSVPNSLLFAPLNKADAQTKANGQSDKKLRSL